MTIGLRNRKTIYKAFLTILNPLLGLFVMFFGFSIVLYYLCKLIDAKTTGGEVPQGVLPRYRG
jgi:hypothetical protein